MLPVKAILTTVFVVLLLTETTGFSQAVNLDLAEVQKTAELGDAGSQYLLGLAYYNGDGVLQDNKKAFFWLTKSASQGNAKGQYVLGRMYQHGHGVKRDYDKAIEFYTMSANQGAAPVQYMLGLMYYHGNCVDRDSSKAIFWLEKAASQGLTEAIEVLKILNARTAPDDRGRPQ